MIRVVRERGKEGGGGTCVFRKDYEKGEFYTYPKPKSNDGHSVAAKALFVFI